MVPNLVYFQKLCREHDIVCVQEHWCWSFQEHELGKYAPDRDYFIKCSDQNDPITGFRLPRGKGGVVILWPKRWSSKIKRHSEGNERIVAIEILGKESLCIINVYMPTNNSLVNSHLDYMEYLDILHNLILKYRLSHKIVLCGDFNGTLLQAQAYNKHDKLLQSFMKEQCLGHISMKEHTFRHHSGKGSSQIDYILSTEMRIIQCYHIGGRDGENSSSHVKVTCRLLITPPDRDIATQSKSTQSVRKLQWEKVNSYTYENILEKELKKRDINTENTIDERLDQLTVILQRAAEKAVPSKTIKLKGTACKASPKVKELLKTCKDKYDLWVLSGKLDNSLRRDNINAKRSLRKQLRREKFLDRKSFYDALMDNPTTDKFYQLNRRNRGGKGSSTSSLMVNDEEISSPQQQRKVFAKYFEDLSVPTDERYDSASLEMCNTRHELITQICQESSITLDPITVSETKKAILQLNSKKAPDEFGLVSEHLKHAGSAVIEDITGLFNQILYEKHVPSAFKSGILTPVLKKSKDPTNMDNYRGITVTPIIGKLFESILLPRISQTFEQSSLQFGFTKGLSPVMSALIVSEARAEAKMNSAPLFLVTLDSKKSL